MAKEILNSRIFVSKPTHVHHRMPLPIFVVCESWPRCSGFVAMVLGDGSLSVIKLKHHASIQIDDVTWKINLFYLYLLFRVYHEQLIETAVNMHVRNIL
jgi:hypothetical protein